MKIKTFQGAITSLSRGEVFFRVGTPHVDQGLLLQEVRRVATSSPRLRVLLGVDWKHSTPQTAAAILEAEGDIEWPENVLVDERIAQHFTNDSVCENLPQ